MKFLIIACLFGIAAANLAKNKPTFQYDITYGGVPARAVDGNAVTNYFQAPRTCTHTGVDAKDHHNKNWWAVDLQERYDIEAVEITNRADCCSERLADYDVVVLDHKPVNGKHLHYTKCQICATRKGVVPKGKTEKIACSHTKTGRYVAIVQSRTRYLTLCEVKVHGAKPAPNPHEHHGHHGNMAMHRMTYQYDVDFGGSSKRAVDGNKVTNYFAAPRTCTHTGAKRNDPRTKHNWWAVDLGGRRQISKVTITNRADCCSKRLHEFDIVVLDHAPKNHHDIKYTKCQVCHHHHKAVPSGKTMSFECKAQGRYVAIVQSRSQYLTLCEVGVY